MTAANFFIKGRDNPVVINFTFADGFSLADFDRIEFKIGGETYATDTDPTRLFVDGESLTVSIGDTTALAVGRYFPEIIGYSSTYDDGYVLSSRMNPSLTEPVYVR